MLTFLKTTISRTAGFFIQLLASTAVEVIILVSVVCLAAFFVYSSFKRDEDIQKFLDATGTVWKFKQLAKTTDSNQSRVSPLAKQARDFALRINPPPPPKRRQNGPKAANAPLKMPALPRPKGSVNAKFKLVATCKYPDASNRSLALLDLTAKGLKWFRQGEEIGHLTIEQVNDGSIVYKDGDKTHEMFVPVTKKKSLLKNVIDSGPSAAATPAVPERRPPAVRAGGSSRKIQTSADLSDKLQPPPELSKAAGAKDRRRARQRRPPARPTATQKEKRLVDDIMSIKKVRNQTDEETRKNMDKLLELLIAEQEEAKKTAERKTPDPNSQKK